MGAGKKQCLLCGQKPHFGPCSSRELFLPIPGGCCEEDALGTTVIETVSLRPRRKTISPLGAALKSMVSELLERKA